LVHRIVEQDRAEIALARAWQLDALRSGGRFERLGPELLIGIEQVGGDVTRLLPDPGLRGRRLDGPRDRRDVVDHVGQRRAGAAVDAGMVHLGIEPDLVVLHAFEHIELPERACAIQELGCIQPTMRSSVARSCGAGRLARKMWRSMSNWSSSTQEGWSMSSG